MTAIRSALAGNRLLLRALTPAGKPLLVAYVLVLVVRSLLPAATAVTLAVLIGRAQRTGGGWLPALLAFGAVLLIGHLLDVVAEPLRFTVAARVDGAHRAELARIAYTAPTIDALESPEARRLLHTAKADPDNWSERTPADGAIGLLRWAIGILGLAAAAAVLARYTWWLVPLLVIPAGLNRLLRHRASVSFIPTWRANIDEGVRAEVWQRAVITAGPAMETRVFGFGEWMLARIERHVTAMFAPGWIAVQRMMVLEWRQFLLVAVPLGVAFAATATEAGSPAAAAAVFAAGWSVYELLNITEDVRSVAVARTAMTDFVALRELLGLASPNGIRPARTDRPPVVRFEDVSFRYPGSDRLVLDGLTLDIRPGELLAVVGLNGEGKSTMIKLLAGLYRPTGGRILADGVDITTLDPDAWRARIAVVFQDFVKYQLTAADNVALGNGRVPHQPAEVAAAATDAGFDEVFGRLPDGWRTPLARARTGGVDLSGGQWQQVVLARSLYAVRTGTRMLVLDEPTAHLDVRTEKDVFARLAAHRGTATVVLISHRLSTVRQADRIVLLDGGRITEQGSHAELMAVGGGYARLFTIQAERFRRGYDDREEEPS
jgi:ABC-type multidrug transport system fused ATPase/permease subunit